MREAGLTTRVDPAGNIFGAFRPSVPNDRGSARPILFGSHIDSVPNGGNFDGDLGSLAAMRWSQRWIAGVATRHPLEMVVWAEEENRQLSELVGQPDRGRRVSFRHESISWNGIKKAEGIEASAATPRLDEARRVAGVRTTAISSCTSSRAGPSKRRTLPIGVVEGIVSIDRHDVTIRGFANHAGTTPMAERQDALVAASQLHAGGPQIVTRSRASGRHRRQDGSLTQRDERMSRAWSHTIDLRDLDAASWHVSRTRSVHARGRSPRRREPRSNFRASRITRGARRAGHGRRRDRPRRGRSARSC